ncbi:hypothetical protein QDZ86_005555, partial [Pluralibacter gergoviae]
WLIFFAAVCRLFFTRKINIWSLFSTLLCTGYEITNIISDIAHQARWRYVKEIPMIKPSKAAEECYKALNY